MFDKLRAEDLVRESVAKILLMKYLTPVFVPQTSLTKDLTRAFVGVKLLARNLIGVFVAQMLLTKRVTRVICSRQITCQNLIRVLTRQQMLFTCICLECCSSVSEQIDSSYRATTRNVGRLLNTYAILAGMNGYMFKGSWLGTRLSRAVRHSQQ